MNIYTIGFILVYGERILPRRRSKNNTIDKVQDIPESHRAKRSDRKMEEKQKVKCKGCGAPMDRAFARERFEQIGKALCDSCLEEEKEKEEAEKKRREEMKAEQEKKPESQEVAKANQETAVVEAESQAMEEMPTNTGTGTGDITHPPEQGLVAPAASIEEVLENWKFFQELKVKLLDKSDLQRIGDSDFPKKSAFRKYATAYNLSDTIVDEVRIPLQGEHFIWKVRVKAVAPNGRQTIGVAMCSSEEKGKLYDKRGRKQLRAEHDVYCTAHTRAKNRAFSDLVGMGEVSAEEVMGND